MKSLKETKVELQKKVDEIKISCEHTQEGQECPIYALRAAADEIFNISETIFSKVIVANKIKLPKFVEIIDSNYNYHFAILTQFNRARGSTDTVEYYDAMICVPETNEARMLATFDASNGEENPPKLIFDKKKNVIARFWNCKIYPSEITRIFHSKTPNMKKFVSCFDTGEIYNF